MVNMMKVIYYQYEIFNKKIITYLQVQSYIIGLMRDKTLKKYLDIMVELIVNM
jgi:hypothetical protein